MLIGTNQSLQKLYMKLTKTEDDLIKRKIAIDQGFTKFETFAYGITVYKNFKWKVPQMKEDVK